MVKLITHPKQTIVAFKRYMGTDWSVTLGNKLYTAIELSALILKSLKEDAEHYIGKKIESAVISVPAYFNNNQRQATKFAAEIANLKVERLINEPTAASLVYGLHQNKNGAKYIILDMGGGTFDVSIVEYFNGVIEIHASSGNNFLGGEDFLNILVNEYLRVQKISKNTLSKQEQRHRLESQEEKKYLASLELRLWIAQLNIFYTRPVFVHRKSSYNFMKECFFIFQHSKNNM